MLSRLNKALWFVVISPLHHITPGPMWQPGYNARACTLKNLNACREGSHEFSTSKRGYTLRGMPKILQAVTTEPLSHKPNFMHKNLHCTLSWETDNHTRQNKIREEIVCTLCGCVLESGNEWDSVHAEELILCLAGLVESPIRFRNNEMDPEREQWNELFNGGKKASFTFTRLS